MGRPKKVRLDAELVAQGYFKTEGDAARAVMAGLVSSGPSRLEGPGTQVRPGIELHVKGSRPYVSRGGVKLAGALDAFGVDPEGLDCLDVGCSSGGFTDCLLRRGARSVVSVDVGRAQFDWSLRNDGRVRLLERTNARDLPGLGLAGTVDLAVCDVSFTTVGAVLPSVRECLRPAGRFLTLVKPQFELPAGLVGPGGVVRDPDARARALADAVRLFADSGIAPQAICASPIRGTKGNVEFFLLGDAAAPADPGLVERLVRKAGEL